MYNEEEIWKPVNDEIYGTKYFISNKGRLKRLTKYGEKILPGTLQPYIHTTYIKVSMSVNGKQKTTTMHRLVAQAFIPNPENKPFVNHKDRDGTNNCVSNLEWVTHSENMQHSADNKDQTKTIKGNKRGVENRAIQAFSQFYELIGTEYPGRTLIGISYTPISKKNANWFGIFRCAACNREFTAPLHQSIDRSKQGKLQLCKYCPGMIIGMSW